jgi:hypothetical protein
MTLRDLHTNEEKQLELSHRFVGHAQVAWKASRAQHISVILHISIMSTTFNESLVFWSAAASVFIYLLDYRNGLIQGSIKD